MQINLKNDKGSLKAAPWGFSVTTLFFGPFVPLFRGDFWYFILMLIAMFCTWGISGLIFPFFYNKLYVKNLVQKGYKPADEFSAGILRQNGCLQIASDIHSKKVSVDITEKIEEINQLKEKGILSQEEFEQQKNKLLKLIKE